MRRIFSRVLAASALFAALASCHRKGDPVREAVDDLAAAARDRDAAAFMKQVAPDFQGADGSRRADVEEMVRRYFAAYESLDVKLEEMTIERSENAALVRFRADLSGRARKIGGLDGILPSSSKLRVEARLAPHDGRWQLEWASWSDDR